MLPKKPKASPFSLPARLALLSLAGGLGLGVPAVLAKDKVISTPPVFVGIDDTGPTWKTTAELRKAAETGDPLACFQYAQLLEVGDQVEQDEAAAFVFYRKAALNEHPEAVFQVGKSYHEGLLGQSVNHKLALDYYERAAYLGSPEATYNVGAMLVSGRGVRRDYVEGLAWLMLATERGTDPSAVDQVKTRLSRYPDRIERAEERLAGIKAKIAQNSNPRDAELDLAPPVVKPATPTLKPQIGKPALPSFAPSAHKPSFGIPKISIPKPKPPPVEPTEPSAEQPPGS